MSRAKQRNGCPECANIKRRFKQKRPPVTESPHAMAHWDSELNEQAGLHPDKLTCGSNKRAHWVCQRCSKGQLHRWTTRVNRVAQQHSGCPYCAGRQACVCNSLQSLYPAVAAEWDFSKNTGTPAEYTASCCEKVWWRNSKRGSFLQSINKRTWYKPRLPKIKASFLCLMSSHCLQAAALALATS